MPGPDLRHLTALLDDTGLAQHASYAVVAREHGYCLDDNARGMLLAVSLQARRAEPALSGRLMARTAAFVQHAWNDGGRCFRNFMSYDRRWLEECGSQDSHGRAVWALGRVARATIDPAARRWAAELLDRSIPPLPDFASPRALAFGLLGVVACNSHPDGPHFDDIRTALASRLARHLGDSCGDGWHWFEAGLSYDNARLSEAMIEAGWQAGNKAWLQAGLDTLDWLWGVSSAEAGCFSPVGSDGFWQRGRDRARFDQQPTEAASTLAAAVAAWRATADASWLQRARRCHAWLLGDNDLGLPLVDRLTGGCRDGLHPDRVNANQGAESTLAWLQADLDMQDTLDVL